MDPRAGVSVVWGMLQAGSAANVIPDRGVASGTVRILEAGAWTACEPVVREAVLDIVRPYGVTATVDYLQGVPPVVNDARCTAMVASTADHLLGPHHRTEVEQSLGGEDFGWYLGIVPGSMFRLGTRTPGGARFDLHQGDFEVDEPGDRVRREDARRGRGDRDRGRLICTAARRTGAPERVSPSCTAPRLPRAPSRPPPGRRRR
ncbi:M20/M25/M40 family metallo-hydrolase [Nocardioides convexus]|uniref:M20/M25/M40 family metallo-hydrolase n=1 Tax=Nocardioides convexus TaxID=2712224 RepID=UPI0024183988|nr:M20/M25/M40 family metallo-hydrolase [Nocardioides convexus]